MVEVRFTVPLLARVCVVLGALKNRPFATPPLALVVERLRVELEAKVRPRPSPVKTSLVSTKFRVPDVKVTEPSVVSTCPDKLTATAVPDLAKDRSFMVLPEVIQVVFCAPVNSIWF